MPLRRRKRKVPKLVPRKKRSLKKRAKRKRPSSGLGSYAYSPSPSMYFQKFTDFGPPKDPPKPKVEKPDPKSRYGRDVLDEDED